MYHRHMGIRGQHRRSSAAEFLGARMFWQKWHGARDVHYHESRGGFVVTVNEVIDCRHCRGQEECI